jgi:hypothetical protein
MGSPVSLFHIHLARYDKINFVGIHIYIVIITMRPQVHLTSYTHCHDRDSKLPIITVNDVCVHPNQGELISCDQAGRIKQWDLSENICTHELVWTIVYPSFISSNLTAYKTPAGDVPIRSVTLAADGSCLVAGNNKVANT